MSRRRVIHHGKKTRALYLLDEEYESFSEKCEKVCRPASSLFNSFMRLYTGLPLTADDEIVMRELNDVYGRRRVEEVCLEGSRLDALERRFDSISASVGELVSRLNDLGERISNNASANNSEKKERRK